MNNHNEEDIEAMRNYVRNMLDEDLTDEQLDELIASDTIQIKLFNFDENTENKLNKLLSDPDVSEEVIVQQINYLVNHGKHTSLAEEGGVQIFEIGDKKFGNVDTSDVAPISPEDFDRLMDDS